MAKLANFSSQPHDWCIARCNVLSHHYQSWWMSLRREDKRDSTRLYWRDNFVQPLVCSDLRDELKRERNPTLEQVGDRRLVCLKARNQARRELLAFHYYSCNRCSKLVLLSKWTNIAIAKPSHLLQPRKARILLIACLLVNGSIFESMDETSSWVTF